jgi:hypothetical protein
MTPRPTARTMKPVQVFGGDASRPLWRDINAVGHTRAGDALYVLGCACQELEAKVDKLAARLDVTESRRPGKGKR